MSTKTIKNDVIVKTPMKENGTLHAEVSNIAETEAKYETGFGGEKTGEPLAIMEFEQVISEEQLTENALEAGDHHREIDAWYGSFPEDLKELKENRQDVQEVIIGLDDRVRINPTTAYPWRAICSLSIRTKTGRSYIGTGWMVGPGTVITAGHCVYLHEEGGWPEYIDVIPGRNGSLKTYGTIRATSFKSVKGWTNDKNRNTDYGAIIMNTKIGNTVGYFGYTYKSDSFILAKTLNLSGYPGDKGGSTQWFHHKRAKSVNARVITYDIDTMGGQSGSPVWYLENGHRYAIGIHTNGHLRGNSATRIVKEVFDNIKNWKAQGN